MKIKRENNKALLLIALLFNLQASHSQDSSRAKAIDKVFEARSRHIEGRREIKGDTITFYMYQPKTGIFLQVIEYWNFRKSKTSYVYYFDSGELKRVVVWKRTGIFEKNISAIFYFDRNKLIYKETYGLDFNDVNFLLSRGKLFLSNATERYKEPEFK